MATPPHLRLIRLCALALLPVLYSCGNGFVTAATLEPDTVLINGKIITVDPKHGRRTMGCAGRRHHQARRSTCNDLASYVHPIPLRVSRISCDGERDPNYNDGHFG